MCGEGQKKTHEINVKVHTNSGRICPSNHTWWIYVVYMLLITIGWLKLSFRNWASLSIIIPFCNKMKNGLFLILPSIEGKNAKPFSFAIRLWFLPQCLAVWDALTLMKFDWVTTNCPPRYRSEMQSWSYPPTFEYAPSGVFTPKQFNNVCGFPELVLQQFETVIGSG